MTAGVGLRSLGSRERAAAATPSGDEPGASVRPISTGRSRRGRDAGADARAERAVTGDDLTPAGHGAPWATPALPAGGPGALDAASTSPLEDRLVLTLGSAVPALIHRAIVGGAAAAARRVAAASA